ncbi:MAG: hypothetical protein RLZZ175_2059 [Bacteroidota bacterium]|jgi:serine protease Do
MKKSILNLSVILIVFTLQSCNYLFLPKKQEVKIKATNFESKIYVNNKEVASGENSKVQIPKIGNQQIVTKTIGYKDQYNVLLPIKLSSKSWKFFALDLIIWPTLIIDYASSDHRYRDYSTEINVPNTQKLLFKNDNIKFINSNGVVFDFKNTLTDVIEVTTYFKNDKNKLDISAKKAELREIERVNSSKQNLTPTPKKYIIENINEEILKQLKITGFIDTLNNVFNDSKNTIYISGTVNKMTTNNFYGKSLYEYTFARTKLNITWNFYNSYGELIDTLNTIDYSGDFAAIQTYNSNQYSIDGNAMVKDAVMVAYNNMLQSSKVQKLLEYETYKAPTLSEIKLKQSAQIVQNVEQAYNATVIVKRKDKGHGSGFAISKDGYIITNFHVIAGDYLDKYSDIKVVLPDGKEVNAKVERVNKDKDLALLKIDYNFDYTFKIAKSKSFKTMQDIYTIGAPKSIELGQSVSKGVIANERNINKNALIQLNIAVNGGNSGGPLFDKTGNLHGIIQSKLAGFATEGVAFAIPSHLLFEYLNLNY